jgi:hypothetical protein
LTVDVVARGIAIAGLVIAILSLTWNIFSWRRQGPTLRIKASCTGRGATMTVSGSVRNIGRLNTDLENVSVSWTKGGAPFGYYVPHRFIKGLTLPQSLPAENGTEFKIINLRDIDPGLEAALHDRRNVGLTFYGSSELTVV